MTLFNNNVARRFPRTGEVSIVPLVFWCLGCLQKAFTLTLSAKG